MSGNQIAPHPLPTLLLVDDEQAFTDTLAFRLETRGIGCLTACNGEEALGLLDRRELEVVLLDLNMPGMHGLEVLRLIKDKRPDIEVVLLTGAADFSVAATGMRRGAGDYLIKPVELDDLLTSIEKATRRVKERKERMQAEEAGKLIALGTLAAGVGHELNNPLQILLHRAEWLQELVEDAQSGAPDYAELLKTAQVIQAQAQRAGGITARLLDLARKSRSGEARVDEAVQSAINEHAERATSLSARLLLEISPDLPAVHCSPAELLAVLSHLIANALDAIDAIAAIAAQTEQQASGQTGENAIRIRATVVGPMLRLDVEDSGEGLAPEVAARMYEPFFSTRQGRVGLGLSLCYTIVTGLGGRLEHGAATAPLIGARVTSFFPVAGEVPVSDIPNPL